MNVDGEAEKKIVEKKAAAAQEGQSDAEGKAASAKAKAKAKGAASPFDNAPLPSGAKDGTVMLVEDIMGTIMHNTRTVQH